MTYRERREARADRLRGWADKRREKANALAATAAPYRGDTAFWTQPGSVPERTRLYAHMDRAAEHTEKAASMEARADSIGNYPLDNRKPESVASGYLDRDVAAHSEAGAR